MIVIRVKMINELEAINSVNLQSIICNNDALGESTSLFIFRILFQPEKTRDLVSYIEFLYKIVENLASKTNDDS